MCISTNKSQVQDCVCVCMSACEHRSTERDSCLLAVVSLCALASWLHLSSCLQRDSKPVEGEQDNKGWKQWLKENGTVGSVCESKKEVTLECKWTRVKVTRETFFPLDLSDLKPQHPLKTRLVHLSWPDAIRSWPGKGERISCRHIRGPHSINQHTQTHTCNSLTQKGGGDHNLWLWLALKIPSDVKRWPQTYHFTDFMATWATMQLKKVSFAAFINVHHYILQ